MVLPYPSGNEQRFGRVRVLVRCRPITAKEEQEACDRIEVGEDYKSILVHNNDADAVAGRRFAFDRVFTAAADQADMFEEVIPLVEHVLDGLHATILAYGQTGSGKTYTMDGLNYRRVESSRVGIEGDVANTPVAQHGMILRAIHYLFDRACARSQMSSAPAEACSEETKREKEDVEGPDVATAGGNDRASERVTYSFRCSYYEIYSEQIIDLLRPTPWSVVQEQQQDNSLKKPHSSCEAKTDKRRASTTRKEAMPVTGLRVRWCRGDTFRVENLFRCECDTASRMQSAFLAGVRQRTMGSHCLNEQSSRSHSIFTIQVRCHGGPIGDDLIRQSELTFVDLAGSEKLRMLSASPSTTLVQQSININTSLFALGKVITALGSSGVSGSLSSSRKPTRGHIPYRDSKLTMLLKHALGGNSLTLMIACIASSDACIEETVNTLLYAGRARNITNVPRVNEESAAALVRSLRREIARLQMELEYYRDIAAGVLDKRTARVQQQRRHASQAHMPADAALTMETEVEVNPHDHARNGGDRRVIPSDSDREEPMDDSTREGRHGHAGHHGEGGVDENQVRQLADSLLDACGMLKRVMHVNTELQRAYAAIKQSNEAAAQREVGLNAENIALRERVAMLETVVLDEAFVDRSPRTPTADAGEASAVTTASDAADVTEGGGRRASVAHTPAPSPVRASTRRKTDTDVNGRADVCASASYRDETNTAPCAAPTHKTDSGDVAETPRHTSPGERTAHTRRHRRHGSRRKRGSRQEHLADVARTYTQRYHNSRRVETYADYYGAAQQLPAHKDDCTGNMMRKVETLLRTMPTKEVAELLPSSLHSQRTFGALSFAGAREEVSAFEQKRQARELRLAELRQRQSELQASVRQEFSRKARCGNGEGDVYCVRPNTTSIITLGEATAQRPLRKEEQPRYSTSSYHHSVDDLYGSSSNSYIRKERSAHLSSSLVVAAAYGGSRSARTQSRKAKERPGEDTRDYMASKSLHGGSGGENYMTKLMRYLNQ